MSDHEIVPAPPLRTVTGDVAPSATAHNADAIAPPLPQASVSSSTPRSRTRIAPLGVARPVHVSATRAERLVPRNAGDHVANSTAPTSGTPTTKCGTPVTTKRPANCGRTPARRATRASTSPNAADAPVREQPRGLLAHRGLESHGATGRNPAPEAPIFNPAQTGRDAPAPLLAEVGVAAVGVVVAHHEVGRASSVEQQHAVGAYTWRRSHIVVNRSRGAHVGGEERPAGSITTLPAPCIFTNGIVTVPDPGVGGARLASARRTNTMPTSLPA